MLTRDKKNRRLRRHSRIRVKVSGTADRPRVVVYKSLKYNYVQFVDDEKGKVLGGASDFKVNSKGAKLEKAKAVGKLAAQKAKDLGIKEVVFDRGGYAYQGRVKAIADVLREEGLKF